MYKKVKTIETKQNIPKQRKKILSKTGSRWHENISTTRCQENRTILDKNIATKIHNEKTEWINNMAREHEGFEESLKVEIHIDLHKMTLKMSNWKTTGHDGIHGFWLQNFISIHERLAQEMNSYLQGAQVRDWMTKSKDRLIQKDLSK